MADSSTRIGIIGTGYVGLVTGVCFAELGFKVICGDVIADKVEMINKGIPPIYEEGLEDLLPTLVNRGLLKATLDAEEVVQNSDLIFICTGTPSNDDGSIDLKYIESAARDIGKALRTVNGYKIVIVKSTVVPGTTIKFVQPILEENSGKKAGRDFGLAMNPEFLKEGMAIKDFRIPERIVIGTIDDKSYEGVIKLYESFSSPFVQTDPSTAEMIKYASNSFLAVKISFINEIANMSEKMGVDVDQVAYGIGLDSRISPKFLRPGIGYGGSCFPKDVRALSATAKQIGVGAKMLDASLKVNEEQPLRVIEMLENSIALDGKRIALLGLSFKPQTDDVRESRAIPIAQALLEKGAQVVGYDPIGNTNAHNFMPARMEIAESAEKALLNSDATILITEWDEFKMMTPDKFKIMKGKIIIDGRRILNRKSLEDAGYDIRVIGSPILS